MPGAALDRPARRLRLLTLAAPLAVYLIIRVAFLLGRDPFFDELFTRWIVARSWPDLIAALRLDSGPVLYYALLKALTPSYSSVFTLRVVTLLLSLGVFLALRVARLPIDVALTAVLLLALYPPHFYFATEARAYALCATFVALAAAAFIRDSAEPDKRMVLLGVVAAAAAAYSHYYGVFSFSFPILFAAMSRATVVTDEGVRRVSPSPRLGRAVLATAVIVGLFIPGAVLLLRQPPAAMAWLAAATPLEILAHAPAALAPAATYPASLMSSSPLLLRVVSVIALFVVIAFGLFRVPASRSWLAVPAVFIAAAVAATAFGRPVYFPVRFESVLAFPLTVGLAQSLAALSTRVRRVALGGLLLPPLVVWFVSLQAFAAGMSDPYRYIAAAARQIVPADAPMVTSGLSYLEIISLFDATWSPRVTALPAAQAQHPGWREIADDSRLIREIAVLRARQQPFFWIGEWGSGEQRALSVYFRLSPVARRGIVVLALASEDRMEQLDQKQDGQASHEEGADVRVLP